MSEYLKYMVGITFFGTSTTKLSSVLEKNPQLAGCFRTIRKATVAMHFLTHKNEICDIFPQKNNKSALKITKNNYMMLTTTVFKDTYNKNRERKT